MSEPVIHPVEIYKMRVRRGRPYTSMVEALFDSREKFERAVVSAVFSMEADLESPSRLTGSQQGLLRRWWNEIGKQEYKPNPERYLPITKVEAFVLEGKKWIPMPFEVWPPKVVLRDPMNEWADSGVSR